MVRRSLCIAAVRAAGRSAGGLLHSSPFFLSVWPRSWRTGRSVRHHWAPAYRTGRTNRRFAAWHIGPVPCHAVPRGTVRTPCRLQRVDVYRSACTRERPAVPDRAACPCHAQTCGTVPRLCRCKGCQPPWPPSAPCALGLAPLFAAMPAQSPIGRGPRLPAPRTHAAANPVGGNAFIPPPPARAFFLGIFVGHVPSFRGCGPREGRPADLWPAEHPRGQAV